MKVYKIEYRYGYNGNNSASKNVLAKDAAEAIESITRYVKGSYISQFDITLVEKVLNVDVFYKTPAKKKRK